MSRKNTIHDSESLVALADQFHQAREIIESVARRFRTENVTTGISVAHQARIDDGLYAVQKFVRELNSKLDDQLKERERNGVE